MKVKNIMFFGFAAAILSAGAASAYDKVPVPTETPVITPSVEPVTHVVGVDVEKPVVIERPAVADLKNAVACPSVLCRPDTADNSKADYIRGGADIFPCRNCCPSHAGGEVRCRCARDGYKYKTLPIYRNSDGQPAPVQCRSLHV